MRVAIASEISFADSGFPGAEVGARRQAVADYLLADDHPLVRSYLAECAAAGANKGQATWGDCLLSTWGLLAAEPSRETASSSGSTSSSALWPKRHRQLFEKQGLDWDTSNFEPPNSVKVQFPGLHVMTTREFEVLALNGVESFPESSMRLIETSQTAGRACANDGASHAGAVLTHGHRYLTNRCRFMLGAEEMRLQSLFFPDQLVSKFDNGTLCSLAGNAFEVTCCSAVNFCGLLALAARRARDSPWPQMPLESSDSSDADEDIMQQLWRPSA